MAGMTLDGAAGFRVARVEAVADGLGAGLGVTRAEAAVDDVSSSGTKVGAGVKDGDRLGGSGALESACAARPWPK